MPRINYESWKPGLAALEAIERSNRILEDYASQGFDLTLRQLYYQHVSRAWIPNSDREYKRLGTIVNKARLAGYIDWDHIVDRTRNLEALTHFRDPSHVIESSLHWFHNERWDDQPYYVEVWIEKDALAGVIEPVCNELDVAFLSCRGYTSQSEMWSASQRFLKAMLNGKQIRVLHLGDHDPSGIDMSRDIQDRLLNFIASDYTHLKIAEDPQWKFYSDVNQEITIDGLVQEASSLFELNRLALNWDQIEQYNPPPNPAKLTDSRGSGYVREYGSQSWELDALEPTVLADLIRDAVVDLRDEDLWEKACDREERERDLLRRASARWSDVEQLLDGEVE